jgi:DNA-binding transcriptional MocR family regulator
LQHLKRHVEVRTSALATEFGVAIMTVWRDLALLAEQGLLEKVPGSARAVGTSGYCTDVFFRAALDWIDRCRQNQKPFFCYLTPNCPHSPYDCPPGSDEK